MTDEYPALYCIDPETNQVIKVLEFSEKNSFPGELTINASKDTLYYLNGDLYKAAISSVTLPEEPFIVADMRNLYRMSINKTNNNIIISDAVDYMQSGYVYIYTGDGDEIIMIKGDIIPGRVCFSD